MVSGRARCYSSLHVCLAVAASVICMSCVSISSKDRVFAGADMGVEKAVSVAGLTKAQVGAELEKLVHRS